MAPAALAPFFPEWRAASFLLAPSRPASPLSGVDIAVLLSAHKLVVGHGCLRLYAADDTPMSREVRDGGLHYVVVEVSSVGGSPLVSNHHAQQGYPQTFNLLTKSVALTQGFKTFEAVQSSDPKTTVQKSQGR